MNVTSIGATPAPLPVRPSVQGPAAAQASPDAGSNETPKHPSERSRPPRPEQVRLPPLEPVSTDEFRVMLGALPVSALTDRRRDRSTRLDVYI